MLSFQPRIGACYSNGDFGRHWGVRQVLAVAPDGQVHCKVLVGPGRRQVVTCEPQAFRAWAKYEVVRNETSWERAGALPGAG